MMEFIELFNPDHLDYFTPDIILGFFAFLIALDLIGAIFEIFFTRRK